MYIYLFYTYVYIYIYLSVYIYIYIYIYITERVRPAAPIAFQKDVWHRGTSLIRNRPPPQRPPYDPRHSPTVGS